MNKARTMNVESKILQTSDIAPKVNEIINLLHQAVKLTSELMSTLVCVSSVTLPPSPTQAKLITGSQLGMLYAIRKKHDIADAAREKLLAHYGITQEADLPATQVQSYRADLLALAEQFNPYFPVEKFLSDGTENPEWKAQ